MLARSNRGLSRGMPTAPQGNIPEDCHPRVRAMIDYWLSIRPSEGLPGRRHFDPVAVPKLLSNTGLIEVSGNPPRFRVRLYGTGLVAAVGHDLTGRWYDEMFERFETTAQYRDFLQVVSTGKPHWRRGQLRIPIEKNYHFLERVHLPLAADGRIVDMILTFAVFFDRDDPFLEARGISAPPG
jgi:hypothetical protein